MDKIEIGNLVATIAQDDDPQSPDDWGNENCFLGLVRSRFATSFGREEAGFSRAETHMPFGEGPWKFGDEDFSVRASSEDELYEEWEEQFDPSFEVFPVKLYDFGAHGMQLRMASSVSAADGFIFVRVPVEPAEKLAVLAPGYQGRAFAEPEKAAEALLDEWNQYLEGDVWWVKIEQRIECEECGCVRSDRLDDLSGIYGHAEAREEAHRMLDFHGSDLASQEAR